MVNKFLFLTILLNLASSQSLVYDFDAANQNIDYWKSNSNLAFTQCNGIKILGGYTVFDMNTKLSTVIRFLDPHDAIKIEVTFWRIDSWNSDKINFDIDGIRQFSKAYQYSNQADQCGITQYDDQVDILTLDLNHNSNSVSILIYALDLNGDNNETWGIQKFQMYITQCLDWQQVYQFFTSETIVDYEGWDSDYPDIRILNDTLYFFHYHQFMEQTLTLKKHTQLKITFYGSGVFYLFIDSTLVLQTYVDQFQNFQILNFEHSSSTVTISLQGDYNCKYVRDFKIFANCGMNYGLPQIIKGCQYYQNFLCTGCYKGWKLNTINNVCEAVCGDNLIRDDEECEDNNNVPFDGCYQCKFQCDFYCDKCIFGKCKICKQGFQLNNNRCEKQCSDDFSQGFDSVIRAEKQSFLIFYPQQNSCRVDLNYFSAGFCGDGFINGSEECDDGNQQQFGQCNQCKLQCDQYCEDCRIGKCQKCIFGYISINFICYEDNQEFPNQIISDLCQKQSDISSLSQLFESTAFYGFEYISALNSVQEQCFQKQNFAQCDLNCLNCNFGICQKCQTEYILVQNRCEQICNVPQYLDRVNKEYTEFSAITVPMNYFCDSVQFQQILSDYQKFSLSYCGDGIANNFEDCDDKNNVLYDGCYQCKFQCDFFCEDCFFGNCVKCSKGFQLVGQICQEQSYIIPANKFEIESLLMDTSLYFDQFAESIQALNNYSVSVDNAIVEIKQVEYQYTYSSSDSNQQIKIVKEQQNFIEIQFFNFDQPESICGNKLVEGIEQCDDGNELPFDGCYECQFQCDYICDSCQFGVCIKCQQYYEIGYKSICQPICNDKVLVPYSSEQCDDGNTDEGDGCANCKYQCSEYCVLCDQTTCFQCELSLSLINNICVCEDGFHLVGNVCVSICKDGFEYIDDQCQAICGDQIVIANVEECDDGNFDPNDGCFNCKFSCPLNCEICINGECKQCIQKYEINNKLCTLIQVSNETQIIENNSIGFCGNGIIDNDEKCDDGNDLVDDGSQIRSQIH